MKKNWIPAVAGMTLPAFAGMTLSFTAFAATQATSLDYKTIPGVSPVPLTQGVGLRGKEDLEAFVDGVMNAHLKYNPLAGATLSIVKDGQVLLVKGYGYADLEKRIKVDGDKTLFRPGSTSKLFTWTAVMQLVEQGKLDLDKDVNEYIPNFKIPATFAQPITLRNLLTHTPGLEDGALGYLIVDQPGKIEPLGDALAKHMPTRVRPATTSFAGDGTNASYSNWGCALAGHIVASVSGMSFDDYVKKNIFEPLGMANSTFAEPLPPALAPQMATGYREKDGQLKPFGFEFVHSFGPAGSLTSSAPDMAKFMLAHLDGGKLGNARILKPETAELMHRRQYSPNPYVNGSGLGFYETWVNGRRIIGHGGDLVSFHADLWLLPEEKLGIFVGYNSSNGVAPYVARRDLLQSFMDRYYPAELPQLKPPADFKQRAAAYAGEYFSNRGSQTKFERMLALFGDTKVVPTDDNKLMISDILLPGLTYWVEVAPDVFREETGADMLWFERNDKGEVTHLVNPFPFIGSYKVPYTGSLSFHYLVLGLGLLGFLVALVSVVRNWKTDRAGAAGARHARRVAALLGLCQFAFAILIGTALTVSIDDLLYGIPTSLYVALAFPLLAIPLTLGVVVFAVRAWREQYWTRYQRIQYSLIALFAVGFLWSLNYWNLVGYHFG